MKRVIVFVVIAVLLNVKVAHACSCLWAGPFVDYAEKSEAVIRARIVGYGSKLSHGETLFSSMNVEVVFVLKGSIEFASIELMGDPGMLCLDYVDSSIFVIGEEFLIALHSDEASQPFGGCGEAWLRLENDVAYGVDRAGGELRKYSIELDELVETL